MIAKNTTLEENIFITSKITRHYVNRGEKRSFKNKCKGKNLNTDKKYQSL